MMNILIAFGMPGPQELILIFLIVLILFGAKRLPELARGLGKSIKEFKRATSEVEDDIREAMKEEAPKNPSQSASASKEDSPEEK